MLTVSAAVPAFLKSQVHNGQDLIDRYLSLGTDLETQVNVSADGGEPVAGRRNTYSDGCDTWWNIRVPKDADGKKAAPNFKDYELDGPFLSHIEAIGSTGWNWKERRSLWLGYDFDTITGHAAGVGVSDEQLNQVAEAAQALPWVEVRRSTGGRGLHLYVLLEGISTANHTEHAALARCVLGMMSREAGFDFAAQKDVCGGNMWIWHRKISSENQGLALIKAAERKLTEGELPLNWKDHVEVVERSRAKVRVRGITDEQQSEFEALAAANRLVTLNDRHRNTIQALEKSGFTTIWVEDHRLLQTHTKGLEALQHRGPFETLSQGGDPGVPNCFMFPLEDGAWKVYKFGQGNPEANTWTQDGQGWTWCYFDRSPDLVTAARIAGGAEDTNGFFFKKAIDATKAIEMLGGALDLPSELEHQQAQLKRDKDGRLVIFVKKAEDVELPDGWSAGKKGWFQKILNIKPTKSHSESAAFNVDSVMRVIRSPGGADLGFFVPTKQGEWLELPSDRVKTRIRDQLGSEQVDSLITAADFDPWKLVNLPFQPEYPGDRQWNRKAAQYKYKPEEGEHPHWDLVLKHCGQDLDEALKTNPWAIDSNVKSGGDYLLQWIACLLRAPMQPLPYLFFHGPQKSGKSIFWEAVALLLDGGVASVDRSLSGRDNFNGELLNAVFCYCEEIDFSQAGYNVYARLKEYVTSPLLWIRMMNTDAFCTANTLHIVHTSNKAEAVPIFDDDDSRITAMYVGMPEKHIPKQFLMSKLRDEAPAFMHTLFNLTLAKIDDRLRVPAIMTDEKQRLIEFTRTPFDNFLATYCKLDPKQCVPWTKFYAAFQEKVENRHRSDWSRSKVLKSLPRELRVRRINGTEHLCGVQLIEDTLIGEANVQ